MMDDIAERGGLDEQNLRHFVEAGETALRMGKTQGAAMQEHKGVL
jgi:hypothetical protein